MKTDSIGVFPDRQGWIGGFSHKFDRIPVRQVRQGFPFLDRTPYIDIFSLSCRRVQDLDPILSCGDCPAFIAHDGRKGWINMERTIMINRVLAGLKKIDSFEFRMAKPTGDGVNVVRDTVLIDYVNQYIEKIPMEIDDMHDYEKKIVRHHIAGEITEEEAEKEITEIGEYLNGLDNLRKVLQSAKDTCTNAVCVPAGSESEYFKLIKALPMNDWTILPESMQNNVKTAVSTTSRALALETTSKNQREKAIDNVKKVVTAEMSKLDFDGKNSKIFRTYVFNLKAGEKSVIADFLTGRVMSTKEGKKRLVLPSDKVIMGRFMFLLASKLQGCRITADTTEGLDQTEF